MIREEKVENGKKSGKQGDLKLEGGINDKKRVRKSINLNCVKRNIKK